MIHPVSYQTTARARAKRATSREISGPASLQRQAARASSPAAGYSVADYGLYDQAQATAFRQKGAANGAMRSSLNALGGVIKTNQQDGPLGVTREDVTYTDPTRGDRAIKTRLYLPASQGDRPAPLVVLSHGLGGSEKTLEYLAEHLTSQGYAVVAMNHPGSDVQAVREAQQASFKEQLQQLGVPQRKIDQLSENGIGPAEISKTLSAQGLSPQEIREAKHKAFSQAAEKLLFQQSENWSDRPQDASFVLDQLEARAQQDPAFAKQIDFDHIAAAGHSYGSYTSLALAGATINMPEGPTSFRDPRIDAAFILSPVSTRPGGGGPYTAESFQTVETPVFGISGTKDDPENRVLTVRLGPQSQDGYMLMLEDRRHKSFGNHGDDATQNIVKGAATTFLNAYLRGDAANQAALDAVPSGDGLMRGNAFFRR
ncbi:MAG: hypothetical protein IPK79_12310 [Vampirovibrionales bacterium]|nr:hypothetical protein [Vampirovibrionales bacterium]